MSVETLAIGQTGEEFVADLNYNFANVNPQMFYFVEDFGITAGVNFSHTELNVMFAALPVGATIVFSKGEYVYVSSQTVTVTKNIHIEFINGSRINALNFTGNYFLVFQGSIGTWESITPSRGDIQITVSHALALTLAKGDNLIMTTSTDVGGTGAFWKGQQGNVGGEHAEVYVVNTTTNVITLYEPIRLDYVGGVRVTKMNCLEFTLRGFRYNGSQVHGNTAVFTNYCKNVFMYDCNIVGAGITTMFLCNTVQFKVENFTTRDFAYQQNRTGNNYGIIMYGCAKGEIVGCDIVGGRHALDPSGNWIPTREIYIHHNRLNGECLTMPDFDGLGAAHGDAMSTHPPAEYIFYEHNYCNQGAGIRNINTIIKGNKFFTTKGWVTTGDMVDLSHAGEADFFIFEDNTIISEQTGGVTFCLTADLKLHYKNVIIKNNTVSGMSAFFFLSAPYHVGGAGDETDGIDNLVIEGNTFKKNSVSGVNVPIFMCYSNQFPIKNLIIRNNNMDNEFGTATANPVIDFYSGKVENMIIQNNALNAQGCMFSTKYHAVEIGGTGVVDIKNVIVTGNYFRFINLPQEPTESDITATGNIVVFGNTFDGCNGDDTVKFNAPVIKGTLDQNFAINMQYEVISPIQLNVV
jgi:hypothetical protein